MIAATTGRMTDEYLLLRQSEWRPYEEIAGVPIWYEEHGDPVGPALVALHGGIVTFEGSFGDVLRGCRRDGG